MAKMIKLYGDLYHPHLTAGILLGKKCKVVSLSDPNLEALKADPSFVPIDPLFVGVAAVYCEYCRQYADGPICFHCGFDHAAEAAQEKEAVYAKRDRPEKYHLTPYL